MLLTYGIQDCHDYSGTQAEEFAIAYASLREAQAVEKYAKTSTEDLTPEQGKELLEAFKAWDDPNPPTMTKVNVYLVIPQYDYQGWDIPVGVFSTLAKAKAARKKCKIGDSVDIIRTKIDAPDHENR
jgi:hypothetical protein